jgi:hypothetical protein
MPTFVYISVVQVAIFDTRPIVTRSAKLFVNLLQVTTISLVLFTPNDMKRKISLLSYAALRARATHATDFKIVP